MVEGSCKTLHTTAPENIILHPIYKEYKRLKVTDEIYRWMEILATPYQNYLCKSPPPTPVLIKVVYLHSVSQSGSGEEVY